MPQTDRNSHTAETAERMPARPHDSGSQSNETVDGLDSTTEASRSRRHDFRRRIGRYRKNAGVRSGRPSAENLREQPKDTLG
jgi:hypothetical protein